LFWSIVILAVGGCIGSFLNVVIYRLPRGLSVLQPRWSFCPACERTISWYDNIPVLSYLLLGGRCRHCRSPISLQYPLVELGTALVFLMAYDAMFVARLREGIGGSWADWPMLAAHLALLGGLIALSVMDLEAYMVDVRVTWWIAAVGVIAHTIWTPTSSFEQVVGTSAMAVPGFGGWIRPGPLGAMVTLAAAIGLAVGGLCILRRSQAEAEVEQEDPPDAEVPAETVSARGSIWPALVVVLLLGLVVGYGVLLVADDRPVSLLALDVQAGGVVDDADGHPSFFAQPAMLRLICGVGLCFVGLALVASCPRPEADTEILEAIDAEAADARRTALWELKLLGPALVLALAATVVMGLLAPGTRQTLADVLMWEPAGTWRPVLGLATGLGGWVLGGAIGWLARVVFTLAFGKEALGMGDVHILAAAGAVAGWPVALLGFFLAAPLALLAIVVIALRRQSRALPYGPWLALAFFVAVLFQDVILRYLRVRWMVE